MTEFVFDFQMKPVCTSLEILLEHYLAQYIGSIVTEEMKTMLLDELRAEIDEYLEDIDYGIKVESDKVSPGDKTPSVVRVTLEIDGSAIRNCDPAQLPKYLVHELNEVRELAMDHLKRLDLYVTI